MAILAVAARTDRQADRETRTEQMVGGTPADNGETRISETGVRPQTIVAAVPGFIDTDDGQVLYAANIMGFNGRA